MIESLRRDLADYRSEHAQLEKRRAEVGTLGPRVTKEDAEFKRL
jgi:hypothetical protein